MWFPRNGRVLCHFADRPTLHSAAGWAVAVIYVPICKAAGPLHVSVCNYHMIILAEALGVPKCRGEKVARMSWRVSPRVSGSDRSGSVPFKDVRVGSSSGDRNA